MRRDCAVRNCEGWTEWSSSNCSVTCGSGTRTRTRTCTNGTPGMPGCPGDDSQTLSCSRPACAAWGEWSDLGQCSRTCGGGVQTRSRECRNGREGVDCPGDSIEGITCNGQACETWSRYSDYSACSVTCGGGTQTRTRRCIGGSAGDPGCPGAREQSQPCNPNTCPSWSLWGPYNDCPVTCGQGIRTRRRTCQPFGTPESLCGGSSSDTTTCVAAGSCDFFGQWAFIEECSVTCGTGQRRRRRECLGGGTVGFGNCIGPVVDTAVCSLPACPQWGQWSAIDCGETCGSGSGIRRRECIGGVESDCPGSATIVESCNLRNCPIFTQWGNWGSCSVTCGPGGQTRVRSCQFGRVGDSGCEGSVVNTRACESGPCPGWGEWTSYTACTATCAGGTTFRSRTCLNSGGDNTACPGSATESQSCNTPNCPQWSEWTPYQDCDAPCGLGNQIRTRICTNVTPGMPGCPGDDSQTLSCSRPACAAWGEWSDFRQCSRTCGGGVQISSRVCRSGSEGIDCKGFSIRGKGCNEQDCEMWSGYTDYSTCSVTCGNGTQTRTRRCIGGSPGDSGCQGRVEQRQTCNSNKCLSMTAGGPSTATTTCITAGSCDFGQWAFVEKCSVTCGDGQRRRSLALCGLRGAITASAQAHATEVYKPEPESASTPILTAVDVMDQIQANECATSGLVLARLVESAGTLYVR